MKKVKVFEDFLSESVNESNIKVGDTVSRKFMGEDPTQTFTVISISGGKAKLKDTKTGEENGMYLSDLIKEAEATEETDGADSVTESFERLPKDVIGFDLRMASRKLNNFYENAKDGYDIEVAHLDNIIKSLTAIKKSVKKFSKEEDIKGTVYEQTEITEMNETEDVNEAVKVEVSLRHARHANELFDDMFKDYGKKLASDVFSFKDGSGARDFIRMMIKNLQIPAGEITADQKYFS